jgi:hypothetical protein
VYDFSVAEPAEYCGLQGKRGQENARLAGQFFVFFFVYLILRYDQGFFV